MKAESNINPVTSFEINELPGGISEIVFFENVETTETGFKYDLYRLTVASRETLATDVETNYEPWLDIAKAKYQEELQQKYKSLVVDYIRQRYSIDDEFAIQRKRETEVEVFNDYNQYVEECKAKVKSELGI